MSNQKISSKHDLSAIDINALPDENLIIYGTRIEDRPAIKQIHEMANCGTNQQIINNIFIHELSHVLEIINRKKYPLFKKDNPLDVFIDFISKKENQINAKNNIINIFNVLAMEMYADCLTVLLSFNNLETKKLANALLNQLIETRKNECRISLEQDFNNVPGIKNTHLTVNALDKIKESLVGQHSLEEMDLLAQKALRYGIMKHLYYMTEIDELKDPLLNIFNQILPDYLFSIEQLRDEIKKEINPIDMQEMMTRLKDENINKSSHINRNKFKAFFDPEDWINENTPLLNIDGDSIKKFLLAQRIKKQREALQEKNLNSTDNNVKNKLSQ